MKLSKNEMLDMVDEAISFQKMAFSVVSERKASKLIRSRDMVLSCSYPHTCVARPTELGHDGSVRYFVEEIA